MAFAQSPSTSQLYSQTEQKEYEALLHLLPVMFCVIFFMLCYWFQLQRRASAVLHPPGPPPTFIESPSISISVLEAVLKENHIDNLPTIVFDEELKARDSPCCVCLGEFEMKQELIQVPSCKHIFHSDCIYNWLNFNTTCPLCRCSVIVVDKTNLVLPPPQRSPAVRFPAIPLAAS